MQITAADAAEAPSSNIQAPEKIQTPKPTAHGVELWLLTERTLSPSSKLDCLTKRPQRAPSIAALRPVREATVLKLPFGSVDEKHGAFPGLFRSPPLGNHVSL